MRFKFALLMALVVGCSLLNSCTRAFTPNSFEESSQFGEPSTSPTPIPSPSPSPGSSPSPSPSPQYPVVEKYNVFEKRLSWSPSYSNPWEQVKLEVRLTGPDGVQVVIGGFYVEPRVWMFRFMPNKIGLLQWKASFTDTNGTRDFEGMFRVIASVRHGTIKVNPVNRFRFVYSDGTPLYGVGIQECLPPIGYTGTDTWQYGIETTTYDADTYLNKYAEAGVNVFRLNPGNCSPGMHLKIDVSGNEFSVEGGKYYDELIAKLHSKGYTIYYTFFVGAPPFGSQPSIPQLQAVQRATRNIIDRWGAYVDYWELLNEADVDDIWYDTIAAYVRSYDPYGHVVGTSNEVNRPSIDMVNPHWYQTESEFESDEVTWQNFTDWKAWAQKPVVVSEQGNKGCNGYPGDPDCQTNSALRMRLRLWTTFFAESIIIFWNTSMSDHPYHAGPANLYMGWEERSYIKVLQDYSREVEFGVQPHLVRVSDPSRIRAYGLKGQGSLVAYVHAYTDHRRATGGTSVTIDSPVAGTAQWIAPSTGQILGTQAVGAGRQTLNVPNFVTDIALKIR